MGGSVELARKTGPKDADLQSWMGNSYEFGYGVEKNPYEAFKWHKAAAEKGDGWSQYKLGIFYEYGKGTEKNIDEAFKWYKVAAGNGDANGQCNLGDMYEYGKGTEKNIEEAFRWYKKAAESGNPRGQYNLGDMYEYGKGTEKNIDEAFRWYKVAAENGNADGQNALGVFYDNGKGTEKNCEEARVWFLKSAEQNNSCAQCNLGLAYEYGRGTSIDLQEAFKWYKKSAENGWTRGEYRLGLCFETGKGTEKDLENAREWYKAAANAGYKDAKEALARLDNQKEVVEEDVSDEQLANEAFENKNWAMGMVLAEKTDLTDARLQYYMGYCYENGFGTAKDLNAAREWYEKAAKQRCEDAIKRLNILELALPQDNNHIEQSQEVQTQKTQERSMKMKKPSIKRAYDDMNSALAEVFVVEHSIDVVEISGLDDFLYCVEMPEDVNETVLIEAANEFFHSIGLLEEDHDLALDEETEYCTVHRNEYSGKYFVLFNHPYITEAKETGIDAGETVKEFGETQRKRIAEEESGESDDNNGELTPAQIMKYIADGIKSGAIRSKSGEGYFVLKGEFFDAIKAGRKTTEYRDLTPRNLAKSIGIKTVKLQRGYGHPGQPPEQMRFEVKSVGLLDADDRECDPYNIPAGFIATTIAIHLGKKI